MSRPFRLGFGLVVLLGCWAAESGAQTTTTATGAVGGFGGTDPFFLYYGYYLPRQAAFAAQVGPEESLRENAAIRQRFTMMERQGRLDAPGAFEESLGFDSENPFLPQFERERRMGVSRGLTVKRMYQSNTQGHGLTRYHSGASQYFPDMRVGYGPNRNLATIKQRRGPMMMGGFGGFPR